MRILHFILLLFFMNIHAVAQQIIARQVPFYYQLFSNEIWDFYQDKEGYLWIGTTNGLMRYDGYNLRTFHSGHHSPNALTDNSIVCMADDDTHLWIGTRRGLNLFEKETCRILPSPEITLRDKAIEDILISKDQYTWVASGGTLYKCTGTGHILKEYSLSPHTINQIYQDIEGHIWVLIWHEGLFRYDPGTDNFINYPSIGEQNTAFTMYQDKAGHYWIGTWGEGLWQFFPDQPHETMYKRHHVINSLSQESDPIFYSLTQDDTYGYLWALSLNALYALEIQPDGTLTPVDINDLLNTHMMFTRIFKDRSGSLWLSSYDMAYTIFFDHSEITNYRLPQIKERLGWDANITHLCMDGSGMMWLNQDRYGICLYDLRHDKLSANTISNYAAPIDVHVLSKSHGNRGIWLGTNGTPRVLRLVERGMNIFMEENIDLSALTPNPGSIRQLLEDAHENLWIVTNTSLFLKPGGQHSLILVDKNLPQLLALATDTAGKVWAISADGNVYQLGSKQGNIICELHTHLEGLATDENIQNMCMDKDGALWLISSLRKVYRTDPGKHHLTPVFTADELEDSSVLDLLSDGDHVWIVTNKKAMQIHTGDSSVNTYYASDGNIFVHIFRNKAMTADGRGGIYVGGHGGFSHIRSFPSSQSRESHIHPAVTDLKVDSRSIFFTTADHTGDQENTVRKVYLNPSDRNIEISLSDLQYRLTPKEKMAYKLEGIDADWITLDHPRNTAFYNRLNKGIYKLWLKCEYEPGRWTDPTMVLTIEKRPAVYETWYALFIYILLATCLVYLLQRALLKRIKAKNDIRFREELNRAKLDYFTNVSHDVLTPLTVIACSVDNIESAGMVTGKDTAVLKSNIHKLKRLIQQILDFRKMEVGRMQLNVSYGNIHEFIAGICRTAFLPLAEKKNIDLCIDIPAAKTISAATLSSAERLSLAATSLSDKEEEKEQEKEMPEGGYGYADFDILDKILYNLLSNAVKYTPENKHIRVIVRRITKEDRGYIELTVADEGIGIHPEEIERIFTRFYTHKKSKDVESNGIGLSLVKDIVNLHHGHISVDSTPGTGSTFTVLLPVDKESYTAGELAEIQSNPMVYTDFNDNPASTGYSDNPVVLLVDDNTELLYILQNMMKEKYNVITATSGKQAWQKLDEYAIDLIISDVMMPEENGWELCQRVKSDLRFNHIPVIMLTAKNGMDDRVTSYEVGADGYIAKPFEKKVLIARVDNLIKSYKTRQSDFQKKESISLDGIAYQSADKKFLQSVIDCIMQHIQEPEFDLDQFSSDMNMSKSTLYRKIKSMTGLTPLDFIRNIKMKQACTLLRNVHTPISEVAYALGFNNPKYFSKCFKDEFGVTPSEYQQQGCVS